MRTASLAALLAALGCALAGGPTPIRPHLVAAVPEDVPADAPRLLVDKDFVAVEFARKNALANRTPNVDVRLSNGFSQVERRSFQVIAANLPAKTGKELLFLLLADARDHLAAGGRLYVVTLSGLRRFIERYMGEVFGNYRKLKQGRSYTVALAELRE